MTKPLAELYDLYHMHANHMVRGGIDPSGLSLGDAHLRIYKGLVAKHGHDAVRRHTASLSRALNNTRARAIADARAAS